MVGLHIVHLYPRKMNIYGDTGNVLVLTKRAERRGFKTTSSQVEIGERIPNDVDIIVSGGGQDSGQSQVQADLQNKAEDLRAMHKDGVTMLTVCGTYQLFGHRFITNQEEHIGGIGVFDMETVAGPERLIGNIVIDTPWGQTVGYENHSGLTKLDSGQRMFGSVKSGSGNNGRDGSEGAVSNNVFGTYLHGPLLPKNPHIADELLRRALARKGHDEPLSPLDDTLAEKARAVAVQRPR